MAVKEYKVISRCRRDLNAITTVPVSGDAEGTTLQLNDEQVKRVLATGAQVFDGDTQIYLSDFAEVNDPQAIPDSKCVDDYTNGDKNRVNSNCKVFGLPRYRKEAIVSEESEAEGDTAVDTTDTEQTENTTQETTSEETSNEGA
jgi:hypothetical protein